MWKWFISLFIGRSCDACGARSYNIHHVDGFTANGWNVCTGCYNRLVEDMNNKPDPPKEIKWRKK